MAKKKRLIPFKMLPAAWGLVGEPYKIAEAHYYYEGKELEELLIKIRFGDDDKIYREQMAQLRHSRGELTDSEFDMQLAEIEYNGDIPPKEKLAIQLTHGEIGQYDYQKSIVEMEHPDHESDEYKLAILQLDYDNDKITKNDFEKQTADIKGEPWIGIINYGYDPEEGVNGAHFEFDWNDEWITFLQQNGYRGHTEDEIVEQWFSHVCRAQALETPYESDPVPFNSAGGRVITRTKTDNGKLGYS